MFGKDCFNVLINVKYKLGWKIIVVLCVCGDIVFVNMDLDNVVVVIVESGFYVVWIDVSVDGSVGYE